MPLPIVGALSAAKLLGKVKTLFRSPWLWAGLLVIGLAAGTFFYLKQDKKEATQQATKAADQNATNKTLEVQDAVTDRQQVREQPLIILREQTVRDYTNARATLNAAPADERNAPAPRLIIDTLNNLDRMRSIRDAPSPASVPDTEVPVG